MPITDTATLGAYAEGFTDGASHIVDLLKAKLDIERPVPASFKSAGWISGGGPKGVRYHALRDGPLESDIGPYGPWRELFEATS